MNVSLTTLHLTLLFTLAVGFYAAVATSAKMAGNDQEISRATFAADSAMSFVRYQLNNFNLDPAITDLKSDQLMVDLFANLQSQLLGTGNLPHDQTISISPDKRKITIPSPKDDGTPNYIYLEQPGTGPRFYATLTHSGEKLRVRVVGGTDYSPVVRSIQLQYQCTKNPTAVFGFKSHFTPLADTYDEVLP